MDWGSAEWAVGARAESCIDAMGVESVVTVWKGTAFIAVGELRQADDTVVERIIGGGGVSEGGKGVEKGRVRALVDSGGGISSDTMVMVAAAEVGMAVG